MKEQTAEAEKEKQEERERKAASSQVGQPVADSQLSQPALPSISQSSPQPAAPSQAVPQPPTPLQSTASQTKNAESSPTQPLKFIHPGGPDGAPQTLEEHVKDLRRQVERLVKAPGAPLKSAPFHTASVLQVMPAGTEVLIVITTSYWFGVETHEGQHGWMLRDDLELLP